MTIDRLKELIGKLTDYNYSEERYDYMENCSDDPNENQRAGHIFETIRELREFINGYRDDEDYPGEYSE